MAAGRRKANPDDAGETLISSAEEVKTETIDGFEGEKMPSKRPTDELKALKTPKYLLKRKDDGSVLRIDLQKIPLGTPDSITDRSKRIEANRKRLEKIEGLYIGYDNVLFNEHIVVPIQNLAEVKSLLEEVL